MKILLLKRTFRTGETIFREGEPGTEAYLIRRGYVSITKTDAGRTIELATRGPGEIIGEMALLDEKPRSATVAAKSEVEVEVITRGDLHKLLENAPEPLVTILHQLLIRLRDTSDLAASLAAERAEEENRP
jgi:CRP-like cAMP-binding protein